MHARVDASVSGRACESKMIRLWYIICPRRGNDTDIYTFPDSLSSYFSSEPFRTCDADWYGSIRPIRVSGLIQSSCEIATVLTSRHAAETRQRLEQISRLCWSERRAPPPGYSLYGVLDAGDGEEGCQVGRVRGDDDESKHPPNTHHHPRGQGGVGHLSA